MQTYSLKKKDIQQDWYEIDAKGIVLGRLASFVAIKLRGKDKPYYSSNLACGDFIIITNADKVGLTGNKYNDKKFYWHTGYPGGLKSTTAKDTLTGKNPEKIIRRAVFGMLPKGVLGRECLRQLKIYNGSEHNHAAQNPKKIEFADFNLKNKA